MSEDERGFESRATDRLVAFSDAVVAIAITLLALDLPVPTGLTMKSFLHSVGHNIDHYVAFLISFVVIAAAWRRYHGVFRYIERVDAQVRNYNVLWLLMIILNPFATRLLTTPAGQTGAGSSCAAAPADARSTSCRVPSGPVTKTRSPSA